VAYGTPANPVVGTVITVAYAVANILDPIRWLRLLTGNADPPGTSYVVVSTSVSGASWQKIQTDVIADNAITTAKILDRNVTPLKLALGAAVTNIGYTPANVAGDTFTGEVDVVGNAGTGNNLRALRLINQAGGNSGVYIQFVSGPSSAMSLGLFVGNALFNFIDVNGASAFYLQSSDGQLYLYGNRLWHAGNLNPAAMTVGDTALLNGQPGTYYRDRPNHTGTQLAATISDLAAAVATMAALSAATAGSATTAGTATAIADGAVSTTAKLANLVVTDAKVATANKDGVAATASMRTLGPGAQQAAGGTHTHAANTQIATGVYFGNGSGPRAITTTLTFQPKIVHFHLSSSGASVNNGHAFMSSIQKITITAPGAATVDGNEGTYSATGFSVPAALNVSGIEYDWVAMG
jgi:hypothetical protein